MGQGPRKWNQSGAVGGIILGVFFPSDTLIYGISRDGSKKFNLRTCDYMILGQLRIGARQAKNAPLDSLPTWGEGNTSSTCQEGCNPSWQVGGTLLPSHHRLCKQYNRASHPPARGFQVGGARWPSAPHPPASRDPPLRGVLPSPQVGGDQYP